MYEARAEFLMALHTGRLEARGPCLVIVAADQVHTVVWPSPGTEWDPLTGTISVNGISARLGATVSLTGGEAHVPPDAIVDGDWVMPPAAECLDNPIWYAEIMALGPEP